MDLFPQIAIWSGGQTGVDQGALEAAIGLKIPHGGFCPKGRRSEIGPIPPQFNLQESTSSDYPPRTKQNITSTHGTLVLGWGVLSKQGRGTKFTMRYASSIGKPCLYIDIQESFKNTPISATSPYFKNETSLIKEWLQQNKISLLNVAGPRESSYPGIQMRSKYFILEVIQEYQKGK